jgi:hypothetical protein
MRKRNCRVEVCFTRDELSALSKKAKKAGLSIGGFIRRSVDGQVIKAGPPADVPQLILEVRRVGANLNQLTTLANSRGFADGPQYQRLADEIRRTEKLIVDSYTMPEN